MSNYIVKTEAKPLFEEELVEEIKMYLENAYLNANNEDRIGFYIPMSWHEFTEILRQSRLDMADINLATEKIHQMRTLNNGIINIICDKDLSDNDRNYHAPFLQGLLLTQCYCFGMEELSGWVLSNFCSRVKVRI